MESKDAKVVDRIKRSADATLPGATVERTLWGWIAAGRPADLIRCGLLAEEWLDGREVVSPNGRARRMREYQVGGNRVRVKVPSRGRRVSVWVDATWAEERVLSIHHLAKCVELGMEAWSPDAPLGPVG